MIEFDGSVLQQLDQGMQREWLETNGIGGFASSTIVGMNTRRYHGLLVASLRPPVDRYVLLSKLEETLIIDGSPFDLSVNQYPGAIHPQGYQYLKGFRLDPFPVFTFEIEDVTFEKSVFLVYGENTAVVQYRAGPNHGYFTDLQLMVRPLIAFRDYHSTTHENASLNANLDIAQGRVLFQPYASLPGLHFAHNAVAIEEQGSWYRNFEYDEERKRGLDFHEDLYNPLGLRFELSHTKSATVIASLEPRTAEMAVAYEVAERQRRKSVVQGIDDDFERALTVAADQFIVSRGNSKSIMAGYHWFADWGRDTMIALPGLTLATGRYDVARSILQEFAGYVDQGMLPNRFPDAGETPEYNTVDATLWFFEAIRQYVKHTNDYAFVQRKLYPVLTSIIDFHIAGTRYGIKVDRDGLLNCGEPGIQLTWMDAKIGDWVVTPRYGKPVEIQALWYNALRTMEDLATAFHDVANKKLYASLARQAEGSFNSQFWNVLEECLFDVVGADGPDASIRPNQIFAVSLHHCMLDSNRAARVVTKVQQQLLTPYGLRTLAHSDSGYVAHYRGDSRTRDSAYHQGTVWPWLLGPFVDAYLRVEDYSSEARKQAREWLDPLRRRMTEFGLGQFSEVCDAEAPYRAGGCIAQAWSVAQVLGVLANLKPTGSRMALVVGR
jgi:predicted glycogen debranching enzyme